MSITNSRGIEGEDIRRGRGKGGGAAKSSFSQVIFAESGSLASTDSQLAKREPVFPSAIILARRG